MSDYGETSLVAVEGRYQAQLERMNAERSNWAETVAMMDGINAGFMAKMAGISPTLDAMFQAAGWTEKYPDAGGGALSLLGDSRPFEYAEGALSGDAMDLAGNLTPNMGTAGSWFTNPGSGQMRMYGQGGFPVVDFDFDHDHGQGIPHAHNWEDNGGPFPIRGPGVRFSPLP